MNGLVKRTTIMVRCALRVTRTSLVNHGDGTHIDGVAFRALVGGHRIDFRRQFPGLRSKLRSEEDE